MTQKQTIVPGPDVVTQYAYDVQDNLNSVTDPNGNITTYAYDDFRRVQKQISPVSGTTSYTYSPAGNLLTSADANAATTTRVYDAANRVTSAVSTRSGFTTETVTYTYDSATSGNYGKGRLATMTDPVGSSAYAYERRGLLRSDSKTISSTVFPTTYAYDPNGNRKTVTYPSLRSIAYTFDYADRPITATRGATTYVSAATYAPFGPETSISYGNGTTKTVTLDQRYRVTENKLTLGAGTLADYTYVEDSLGNITQINDVVTATYNRTLAYDDLNRLTTANSGTSLWGTATGNGFVYDKMGNVTSLTLGTSRTASFVYSGTLPKLTSVTETGLGTRSVSYDNAGNELQVGTGASTYSTRNFLRTANSLTYGYDGQGLRTTVTQGTNKRHFFYSPEMSLLEETSLAATPTATGGYDQIWFNGHPVAEEDGGTHWTFTDHLGTPFIQTDAAGAVFWRAEYEPYGKVFSLRTANQHAPLRLPGQEAEELNLSTDGNGATERFYNVFRWYRPRWGRYTQTDPVGLHENLNLYTYTLGNPLTQYDSSGLRVNLRCRSVGDPTGSSIFDTREFVVRYVGGAKHCFLDVVCPKAGIPDLLISYPPRASRNDAVYSAEGRFKQWPIAPPPPNCNCEFERCLLAKQNELVQGGYKMTNYRPVLGPNSDSYATSMIRLCGGVAPVNAAAGEGAFGANIPVDLGGPPR